MAKNPPPGDTPPANGRVQSVLASLTAAQTGTYDALVRGTRDYWTNFMARGASPVEIPIDLLKWWGTALRRERPRWSTPHEVIAEWSVARLRDFSDHDAAATVPLLLLPPQAGHDSCIVDFAEGQSQVSTALEAGHTRVYALDWIGATPETKHSSITTYISIIDEAVQMLGGRVNIVGDAQGGWLATIYAALHPQAVSTLTVAGAPIDHHVGEPLIHGWLRSLTPGYNLGFYRNVVAANGGVLPGDFLLAGFMGMRPHNELSRQLQLLAHVNDKEHVARYRTFETWFQWTQAIPGDLYLWIIEHLFQKNQLVKGGLVVSGHSVNLAEISAPLYLIAGTQDHITPAAQVWALAEHVSTAPELITKRAASGGHLDLFMGHDTLLDHWRPVFTDMLHHSGSREPAAQPAPAATAPAATAPAPTSPAATPAPPDTASKAPGSAKRRTPSTASRRSATATRKSAIAKTAAATRKTTTEARATAAPGTATGSATTGSQSRKRAASSAKTAARTSSASTTKKTAAARTPSASASKAAARSQAATRGSAAASSARKAATRTVKTTAPRTQAGQAGEPTPPERPNPL